MADLQAMLGGCRGELDMPVEDGRVHFVEHGHHLVGRKGTSLFDRALQHQSGRIPARSMVSGDLAVGFLVGFGELLAGWTEVGFVDRGGLPLRRHQHAVRRVAKIRKLGRVRRNKQADHFQLQVLLMNLASQSAAVGEVAATDQHGRSGGHNLVQDRAEVAGGRIVGFIQHHLQADLIRVAFGAAGCSCGKTVV